MINNLSVNGFEKIYKAMFAGKIANHSDDVYQSIVYNAGDILRTDKVHLGFMKTSEAAYYFAAPSEVFSSVLEFSTPLVCAIPSHPEYKGDGAYILSQGNSSAVVISVGPRFELIFNNTDLINEMLIDMELPVYEVFSVDEPLAIESTRGKFRQLGDVFSRKVIKVAALVNLLSFGVGAAASLAHTAFTTKITNANETTSAEMNALVTQIEYSSPLSKQLGQFNKISATVVRAGGWINEYVVKGEHESFVVTLPEWVTNDYIQALGPGAVSDIDSSNNNIKVTKK